MQFKAKIKVKAKSLPRKPIQITLHARPADDMSALTDGEETKSRNVKVKFRMPSSQREKDDE